MQRELTAQRLRELLHYDEETGHFTWRVSRQCVPAGARAGSLHKLKGYINIRVDLKSYRAHRLAWLYVHGCWPTHEIDHKNRVKTDNRIANLRDVPHMVNQQNHAGAKGATRRSHGWQAKIKRANKYIHLGTFGTEEEAVAAYQEAKPIFHHESAGI